MGTSETNAVKRRSGKRRFLWFLAILLLIVVVATGIKGWRTYQKGMIVYGDITALRNLARAPVEDMDFETVTSSMIKLQNDLGDFAQEARPFLWLAPKLGWVPTHGGDLANVPSLIDLADHLINASITTLQATKPLLMGIDSPDPSLDPAGMTILLVDAQPQLLNARNEFNRALEARSVIQVERLSPRLQNLVVDELDPLLTVMDDGLSLSTTLPIILGADGGPKSYLLLVQNEDELRTTGGFITTVGNLIVRDGEILKLHFEGVDNEEDWTKPFPESPWQLQEYMNASVLILRDSNWFTNFPTSASWAKYLYSYNHSGRVDGVIAFDQQFLVMLLGALGPLDVEGAPYVITSGNVIDYMRSAKEPPPGEVPADGFYRKDFIRNIADAVLKGLVSGGKKDWRGLAITLTQALDERHLLMQFEDPIVESLLAEHDWDGVVRPFGSDFLMTTDSNIGFNKTNALMDISLSYDVDLTDVSSPMGSLVLTHKNNANGDVECIHFDTGQVPEDYSYPMDRCYWSYTRVYKQAGAELLDGSPHDIPAKWMLLGKRVLPRVDVLDEEIEGVQGYGTLLVVPGGQTISTGFDFSLPAALVASNADDPKLYTYRLKVQKQPGTLAKPLIIRIHLPKRSQVDEVSMDALIQGESLLIETDLRADVYLEVVFHVP